MDLASRHYYTLCIKRRRRSGTGPDAPTNYRLGSYVLCIHMPNRTFAAQSSLGGGSTAPTPSDLAPVVDDMGAYIIAGAVRSERSEEPEADERTPAQGLDDGVAAERLGFRRVWLSERWDVKQADTILAGVAARTTRLGLGAGAIQPTTRHPLMVASWGATMSSCFGPRFVLGMGRGDTAYNRGLGVVMPTVGVLGQYADIVRRLWNGETVSYDGRLGTFEALAMGETYHGVHPQIWYATFGNPLGAKAVAAHFDGAILPPVYTPEATAAAVQRIRRACELIDRDPMTVRIVQPVVTAPSMDEAETRAIAHGRTVTYLQYPLYGDALAKANGWDMVVVERLRNHEFWKGSDVVADHLYHRYELMQVAEVIPDGWMYDANAIGTVAECVTSLQRYRDAGVDEIATYGSTPAQNAELIAAWRQRPEAAGSTAVGAPPE